jgi:YD repeat-containing protein
LDALARTNRYAYNNAGQLTNVDFATDQDVSYGYDNLGRMTGRVDAAGTWSWTYDGQSARVLSERLVATGDGGRTSTVSYAYATGTFDLASVTAETFVRDMKRRR